MDGQPVKVGIVGLGRWAKVLAAAKSESLKFVSTTRSACGKGSRIEIPVRP
jgi:hypothetical protein